MGIHYNEDEDWPEISSPADIEEGDPQEMMMANPVLQAQAKHEIQTAIVVAQKFPRNEDKIFQQFVHGSCKRLGLALVAQYYFKRGKRKDDSGNYVDNIIQGPTVKFARELTRIWRNVRYGSIPIGESEESRQILSYAWDLETNVWIQQGDLFEKTVEKKDGYHAADERELRELTNRRASIGIRNCLLQIVPPDFIDDGIAQTQDTIKLSMSDKNSPQFQDVKKRIIGGFSALNVPIEELEQYIGHALASCDPKELETLRGIWTAIKDGHTTWASYRKVQGETAVQGLPTEIRRASQSPKPPPAQTTTATATPANVASNVPARARSFE